MLKMHKHLLRQEMLSLRHNLDSEYRQEASKQIVVKLIDYIQKYISYKKIDELNIYAYMPINSEVDLRSLYEAIWLGSIDTYGCRINLAFPRVYKNTMDFYLVNSYEDLEPGCFDVMEPKTYTKLIRDDNALVLVPAIAYSDSYHRLGYGKGYYDRYFATLKFSSLLIGIIFKEQLIENLRHEISDISMHKIIHN